MRNENRIAPAGTERPREGNEIYRVVVTENVMPGNEGHGNPVWSEQDTGGEPETKHTFLPVDVNNPDRSFWIYDANDCNSLLFEELAWVRYDADIGRFVPVGSQGLIRHAIATEDVDGAYDNGSGNEPGTEGTFHIAKEGVELEVPDPSDPQTNIKVPVEVFVTGQSVAKDQLVLINYFIGEKSTDVNDVNRPGQWRLICKDTPSVLLRRCSDNKTVVAMDVEITEAIGKLSDNIGKVVAIRETALLPEACWTIVRVSDCIPEICPSICTVNDSCSQCVECWKLTLCVSPFTVKVITSSSVCSEASFAIDAGDVVLLDDGNCYTMSRSSTCSGAVDVTILAKMYDCDSCGDCYELTKCWSSGTQIIYADDHDLEVGNVVKIGGECWEVTDKDTCATLGGTPVRVSGFEAKYDDCTDCGCYYLTHCGGGTDKTAYRAEDPSSDVVDLAGLIGKTVRLDDGECYIVSLTSTGCDSAPFVVVQESYDGCSSCLVYELDPCDGGANVTTYSDLSVYATGDIIRRAEDSKCYEILGTATWASTTVETTVEESWPEGTCADCTSPKYALNPTCPSCEDVIGATDCDAESGGNKTPIAGSGSLEITDDDLSAFVGQYIKWEGVCYLVSLAENSDTVTESSLDYTGPFADCESCQKQCLWIVTDVYDGTTKIGQKKTKVVVDMVCEEDDLDVVDIEDC